ADALSAAYLAENEHGQPMALVHGGLSPDRVVVTAEGYARVIDFGTPSGTRYHAPEVLAGAEPSPRSDVFALGVILYALVTGQHAWPGRDADLGRTGRLLPPRNIRADLPRDLDVIVRSCLETRPSDRPRDAVVLAETLSDWLEQHGGPVPDEALSAWGVEDAPSDGPRLIGTRPGGQRRIEAPKGLIEPAPEYPTWPRPAALSEMPTVPDVQEAQGFYPALDPEVVAARLAELGYAEPTERMRPVWAAVALVGVALGGGLVLAWFSPELGLPSVPLLESLRP
ncbi:MAG: protein kinase, partial [Myxococcota bacterium]